jgi:hypothetical protein
LRILQLGANKFTSFPLEIKTLAKLQNLNLSANDLSSIPADIGAITSLVSLNVSRNKITSLPAQISTLTNLNNLDVSYNKLATIPGEIYNAKNLLWLNCTANLITSLPNEIGRLKSLALLELDTNRLTNLPDSIVRITSLFTLDLGYNQLDTTAMSTAVKTWADTYDPDWRKTQGTVVEITAAPAIKSGNVSLYVRQSAMHLLLPVASPVIIQVYDAKGRLAATPVDAYLKEGAHTIPCDFTRWGSGIYYLKLSAGKNSNVYKLVSVQ